VVLLALADTPLDKTAHITTAVPITTRVTSAS
jgi:hypothetical protein